MLIGTNFYGRIIPTKKRREDLCKLINVSNNPKEIMNEVNKTYRCLSEPFEINEGYGEIHLGKRSGGWKFLWNPNVYKIINGHTVLEEIEPGHTIYHWVEDLPTYFHVYPLTKKGIREFIDRPNIEIYDEYGDRQDKNEFFDMAINWITWIDHKTNQEKEAWDGKSYQKWEESQGNYHWHPTLNDESVKVLIEAGYNVEWPYTDFYSDGLRFSTSNSFS